MTYEMVIIVALRKNKLIEQKLLNIARMTETCYNEFIRISEGTGQVSDG